MAEEKFSKNVGWDLWGSDSKTKVGAVLGAEDRKPAVNKLWISGPEARPDESKSGLGGTEKPA